MVSPPSITLAIPCFNAGRTIGRTLDAVMRQTRIPDEIIVVDDGSTDDSCDIIQRHSRIRLFKNKQNNGIGASRNTAYLNASGDVIVFVDADTVLSPAFISEIISGYAGPEVAGVGGQAVEKILETPYDRWRRDVLFQSWGDRALLDIPFLFGVASSYRVDMLKAVSGFDPFFRRSGEDMDMGFRLRSRGYKLRYNPNAMVDHIRTDTRASIAAMTYRHCYYGFLAQRKNRCFENKTTLLEDIQTFYKKVFIEGIREGILINSVFSLQLYGIVAKAWVDARRAAYFCWDA